MLRKIFATSLITLSSFVIFSSPVFAHIVVKPSTVNIATTQDFTVIVPNEKDNPIIAIKLIIPHEVTSVIPYAINGWTIATQTDSNHNVTEIDWTEGSISVGQAQEFSFAAQAPAQETTIAWKAYQIYSDGTIVSWDVDPKTLQKLSDTQQDQLTDKQNKGAYSTTKVINDFIITPTATPEEEHTSQKADVAIFIGLLAIVSSGVAISFAKKQEHSLYSPRRNGRK